MLDYFFRKIAEHPSGSTVLAIVSIIAGVVAMFRGAHLTGAAIFVAGLAIAAVLVGQWIGEDMGN